MTSTAQRELDWPFNDPVIVSGFGTACMEVADALRAECFLAFVMELNPVLVARARESCELDEVAESCMWAEVGDATQEEILSLYMSR